MVLTATATKATKQQILHTLHICEKDLQLIEQSPDRRNLFYGMSYLDKNDEIELAFSSLISEVKELNTETARTLIYYNVYSGDPKKNERHTLVIVKAPFSQELCVSQSLLI